jgi:two-component SAPR family response regulator
VEAFRINAIDYLVKPLVRVQLKETLERIMQKIGVATYSERPTIYCFGKFAVCTKQGEVRFRTQKAEELLAFFVDRRGGEISRNEIVDSIWGEFDGQKAVNHFNTTLYYMKKALLQSGAEITVERVRDRYRLDIDQFECDYIEFISFVSSAETVDKCTTTDYERAIDLYQGDYLAGNDFSWGERNRAYLKEKYIDIVLKTADYYRAAGKFGEAIDLLKTSRRYEPLHNEIYYWLIETFLFAQDKLSAVKYYNTYKNCLEKEFGLEPDEKINNLMRKVKGIS